MKSPAKIFVNDMNKEDVHLTVGVFRNRKVLDGLNVEYICRDVVIDAMIAVCNDMSTNRLVDVEKLLEKIITNVEDADKD